MKNLIKFIINYHFFLMFLVFEIFALTLSIKHSEVKARAFMTSANSVSGFFYKKVSSVTKYFSLTEKNKKLKLENNKLLNKLAKYEFSLKQGGIKIYDEKFSYSSAEIIKNSVFSQNNFLTIDKGSSDGIKPDMAVVSSDGVIGITAKVSSHFTTVISLLNKRLGISGKLKRTDYFGSVRWDGNDYRYVTLKEIPNYIDINKGDTVITSGYSYIFPPDIIIGFVEEVTDVKENNFFKIKVKLNPDFKNVRYVYVIDNKNETELDSLTAETEKDFQH